MSAERQSIGRQIDRDDKLRTIEAMRKYGGSFVKALAEAWAHADAENSARIEAAFPDYVTRYRGMAA